MKAVTGINPANPSLAFIDDRLSFDSYRGLQSSQHNRYTMSHVHTILTLLDKYAPNQSLLKIRTTDTSKRFENLDDEENYAFLCDEAKRLTGIGTQDAMRKNLFVDWHRMGLINRYNKNKVPVKPYSGTPIAYVSLSPLGISFISEKNLLNRNFLFSKAVNKLLNGFVENILNLLTTTDIEVIDFYEFMFFVSAINHPDYGITVSECESLINDYRRLTRKQELGLITTLKNELVPEKFKGNKNNKRDFHNWVNKYQQAWYLFTQVLFFIIDNTANPEKLMLSTRDYTAENYDKTKMKRSVRAKNDYFEFHHVTKVKGYELDHIIPLLLANSIYEYGYLDSWENLLYIDGKTHAIKTQSGSKFNELNFNPADLNEVYLVDYENRALNIRNGIEAFFNSNLIPQMVEYNKSFLDG